MTEHKCGIYGLGLIGASVALAVKNFSPDMKVVGFGRDQEKLDKARRLGIIDEIYDGNPESVGDLDFFIIGTPPETVGEIFSKFHNYFSDDCIIMDVASVKRNVIESVSAVNERQLHFIATHPMAGSEKSGMDFARADLFEKKIVAVIGENQGEVLERVRDFWKGFGAQIVLVSADFHDEIVASTSHAPHLIASALASQLEKDGWSEVRFFGLYGKGLLDTTRISQGHSPMWADIILSNNDNVERSLVDFKREIEDLVEIIHAGDREKLINYLDNAADFRKSL